VTASPAPESALQPTLQDDHSFATCASKFSPAQDAFNHGPDVRLIPIEPVNPCYCIERPRDRTREWWPDRNGWSCRVCGGLVPRSEIDSSAATSTHENSDQEKQS